MCSVSSVIVHQLSWTGTVHPQCVLLPLRVPGPFTAFHIGDEWSLRCSPFILLLDLLQNSSRRCTSFSRCQMQSALSFPLFFSCQPYFYAPRYSYDFTPLKKRLIVARYKLKNKIVVDLCSGEFLKKIQKKPLLSFSLEEARRSREKPNFQFLFPKVQSELSLFILKIDPNFPNILHFYDFYSFVLLESVFANRNWEISTISTKKDERRRSHRFMEY